MATKKPPVPWRAGSGIDSSRRRARRRRSGRRKQRELGRRCEESFGLGFGLLPQQRAGDVDKPTSGLHRAHGAARDLLLLHGEVGQIPEASTPFGVGVAPQGPGAEARRIDQHSVESTGAAITR